MTEPHTPESQTPESQTPRPQASDAAPTPSGSNWIKAALAVSVALNLAVAGLAAGAFLRTGPGGHGMPHDLSFGPFSEALDGKDRRALRKALMDRLPSFKEARAGAQVDFVTLLDALRANPFDEPALQSALAAIKTRNADRLELGRSLIETRILQMSRAERLAFAERLEKGLRRPD